MLFSACWLHPSVIFFRESVLFFVGAELHSRALPRQLEPRFAQTAPGADVKHNKPRSSPEMAVMACRQSV